MRNLLIAVGKTASEQTGGVQTRIINYARYLPQHGVRPIFLAFRADGSAQDDPQTYHKAPLYRWPQGRHWSFNNDFKNLVAKHKIESVHILEGVTSSPQMRLQQAAVRRRLTNGLSIYGGETMTIREAPGFLGRHQRRLEKVLDLADIIAVNSKATAKFVPSNHRYKIGTVYPGANMDLLKHGPQDKEGKHPEPRVLFVGRLYRRKGVDDVIEAAAHLKSRFPDLRVKIVGRGVEGPIYRQESQRLGLKQQYSQSVQVYQALADKLGIAKNVDFVGEIRDLQRLAELYQWCDVFTMPSKLTQPTSGFESFGCTFLEASLFAKPVVGTRHFGIKESVLDEQTGLLVAENNSPALAQAIARLIDDPDLAKRLGQNGFQRTTKHYRDIDSTKQLASLYT